MNIHSVSSTQKESLSFIDPDFCPTVVRRRITDDLIYLLAGIGEVLVTRGRSLTWNRSYPSRSSYDSAFYRLKKAGLIAHRLQGGKVVLELTEKGRKRVPDECKPMKFWNREWDGIWHLLVYDIPEKNRCYRETLRRFLHRMRMGCLQRSVYVSHKDIRPEYDDLVQAARVERYSYLFAAKTVLGRPALEIVHTAWKVDRLEIAQSWYLDVCSHYKNRLSREEFTNEQLTTLAREEMSAYMSVMEQDPLLPRELWPTGYLGEKVYKAHCDMAEEIGKRL